MVFIDGVVFIEGIVFIQGIFFIEGINCIVFNEDIHRRKVIVSIHGTNIMHKVESKNMDGVEDGTHDAIFSITQSSCINLMKYLKVSNENDFSILLNRL